MDYCKSTIFDPFNAEEYQNDLIIQMAASQKYLIFRDGIDSFDRSYSINWDSVNVYGRQDPIQTYQSTGETINLSFPLKPRDDPDEFNHQLEALLALGKFARPVYSNDGIIIESPILKIRFRNLIVEEYNGGSGTPLWIAPTSISVNYGDRARDIIAPNTQGKKLVVPKRISISLNAAVINVQKKYYTEDEWGLADVNRAADVPDDPNTTQGEGAASNTLNNQGGSV